MAIITDDNHFRQFAASLEKEIDKYGEVDENKLVEKQKEQVERLVGYETELREVLKKHPNGHVIYKKFVTFITEEKKNILAARPYFRERQEVFTAKISILLRDKLHKGLMDFHFNYSFVLFCVRVLRESPESFKKDAKFTATVLDLAEKISDTRKELVEMNMPLAISRSRLFWSKTPKSHLSYMDFIQISCEGLMSAVDKFVLPYSTVFRAVAIGRMLGNFIEQYSETLIHFFPIDRRKIYRANKAVSRMGGLEDVDYEKLAAIVNEGVDESHRTTPGEIADLLAAASCVSSDAFSNDDEDATGPVDSAVADDSYRPDLQYETVEVYSELSRAIKNDLTPFERKLIRMKGVTL